MFKAMHRTEIKRAVAKFIGQGGVILCEKTKAAYYGGKHLVSVGPFRAAVPDKQRFALITTGRRPQAHSEHRYFTAWDAASDFVNFVGNEIARDALARARSREA